jgi:hypothetical protein
MPKIAVVRAPKRLTRTVDTAEPMRIAADTGTNAMPASSGE